MTEQTIHADVCIAGAGLSGIAAALEAEKNGAKVVLLSLAPVGFGSNSALSNGVFAGPTSSYSPEAYIADTMRIGKFLNDENYVRRVAVQAEKAVAWLRSLGVNIIEESDHYRVLPTRASQPPGSYLMSVLRERLKHSEKVRIIEGAYLKEILVDDQKGNAVAGIVAVDRSGKTLVVEAYSVVLATGGGAAVYGRNDNHRVIVGQGYALAAMSGLALYDMELVQFYPIALAEPGLPAVMLPPPHPPGTALINSRGEDLLEKYGLGEFNRAIRFHRDKLSLIILDETSKTGGVYVDYTRIHPSFWEKPPLCRLLRLKYNFRSRAARVLPVAHFFMGGVRVNEQGMTDIPGLFACGELLWGLHGANRRGGNALTECVLSGLWAGRGATDWTASSAKGKIFSRRGKQNPLNGFASKEGRTSVTGKELARIKNEIGRIAWEYVGLQRSEELLLEARRRLIELFDFVQKLQAPDLRSLFSLWNLRASVVTLSAVVEGSLLRKENIGSFVRVDIKTPPVSKSCFHTCLVYNPVGELLFSSR